MIYCVHCNTELPEGARYCFKCGKAVYQIQAESPFRLPAKAGGLPRVRFMDLEPLREEQRSQDKEYLRNAANFVSVDPEAAALVVYGNGKMHGETFSVSTGYSSSPQISLKDSVLYATILPKQVNENTFYVAIFPRIYFFDRYDDRKADITHATCTLRRLRKGYSGGYLTEKEQVITLYPGLITEVDWSREGL